MSTACVTYSCPGLLACLHGMYRPWSTVWSPTSIAICSAACATAASEGVARRVRRPKTSDVELLPAIELKGASDRRAVLPLPPPRSDAEATATVRFHFGGKRSSDRTASSKA